MFLQTLLKSVWYYYVMCVLMKKSVQFTFFLQNKKNKRYLLRLVNKILLNGAWVLRDTIKQYQERCVLEERSVVTLALSPAGELQISNFIARLSFPEEHNLPGKHNLRSDIWCTKRAGVCETFIFRSHLKWHKIVLPEVPRSSHIYQGILLSTKERCDGNYQHK